MPATSLVSLLLALPLGCGEASAPLAEGELVFVRGGMITPGPVDGAIPVGGGRSLLVQEWEPGHRTTVGAWSAIAPARPECRPLFHVPLSDVSPLSVQGGVAPNALSLIHI